MNKGVVQGSARVYNFMADMNLSSSGVRANHIQWSDNIHVVPLFIPAGVVRGI